MKITITGGAGFIGSHISEYWINRGYEVHIIDNFRTGRKENLNGFNVVLHEGSVTNRELVFDVIKNSRYVFNLASMVSVPESLKKPWECIEINVKGLLNVLEASRQNKVRKVINSSSASVYGNDPELPKSIFMKPNPITPYAISKLDGEYYSRMYTEQYSLKTISLRYFNVFGPRQDIKSAYAAAVPIFINKALDNEKIIIYGDGDQTRDFIYVKDVVEFNIAAALNETVTGVLNIAHGVGTSINELIEMIITLTGSESEIEYLPTREGDVKHSVASIIETQRQLGYKPEFNLAEGLRNTIEFFKTQRELKV